ncbi:MAG TPA: hypothetical protein VKJ00_14010 [Thermoanaerobaculia bacterium]|nr:hypothetical protein [Thermoanaerobaculia bacterium]HMF10250.1 hypothetical protein [Thermoanaerobaculia bacterium]
MNRERGFSRLVFVVLAGCASLAAAASSSAQIIDEFSIPSGGRPLFITPGPGGMWFTESSGLIGRVTPDGRVTEFPITVPAWRIVAGPDGNLWYTSDQFLSRMTPEGAVTNLPISGRAFGVAVGRDGNIWFSELQRNGAYGILGRATTDGQVTEVLINSWAEDIAVGSDGNFWLPDWTEIGDDAIVRVTPSGSETRFPLPGGLHGRGDVGPTAVAVDVDGNIWFVLARTVQVGRMTPPGSMAVFDLAVGGIAAASDGGVWFTSSQNNAIGRLTSDGRNTQIAVPSAGSLPWGIAEDAAGNIWFAESGTSRIARLTLRAERASPHRTDRERAAPGGPPGPRQ